MMVVMLILLTATALAGVALQATEYELRSAGFGRSAVQTQYVSETAMVTTLSWVEALALDNQLVTEHLGPWNRRDPPKQFMFGEPEMLPTHRDDANRTTWLQQASLRPVTIPPLTVKDADNDPVGTFGPRVAYHPGVDETDADVEDPLVSDYVVDMYDCQWLDGIGSPGSQVNQGGSGKIKIQNLYCVITSRGRSFLYGGQTKTWNTGGGKYVVNRFALAHDSRGTLVSPSIPR